MIQKLFLSLAMVFGIVLAAPATSTPSHAGNVSISIGHGHFGINVGRHHKFRHKHFRKHYRKHYYKHYRGKHYYKPYRRHYGHHGHHHYKRYKHRGPQYIIRENDR